MESSLVPTLFFYLLAGLSVIAAVAVVAEKRLLRSAVALIVVLAAGAGFAILLGFELIAGIQILVFIGGIVVLLVFAIMMTSDGNHFERPASASRKVMASVSASLFFILTMGALYSTNFPLSSEAPPADEVRAVGHRLLSNDMGGFIVPFELISLLLLAALIGSIVVARKTKAAIRGAVEQ